VRRVVKVVIVSLVALVVIAVCLRSLARSRSHQVFGQLISRVDTRDSVVALTFDDGPVDSIADALIDTLKTHNATATFFLIGEEVRKNQLTAARILRAGNELGNHSLTHDHMVLMGPGRIRHEVEETDRLLSAVGQKTPIYFRPPYGYKLVGLPWFLWRTGRVSVTWDIEPDSYPEIAASPDRIVSYVVERVKPGSIILLHPWYGNRRVILATIGPLVDTLRQRGYRVTTVANLINAQREAVPRR
jgi:peptidoglycan-N-acetylglucosamine deacetylase